MGLCGQLLVLVVVGASLWGLDQVRPKNEQTRGRARAKPFHGPVILSPNKTTSTERVPHTVEAEQRVERAIDQFGNPCLADEYKEQRSKEYRCRATAAIEGLGTESCGITCAVEINMFSGAACFALFSLKAPVVTQLTMLTLTMVRMQVLGISQTDIRIAELEKSVSVLQIRVDTFQIRVDALTLTNTTASPTTELMERTTTQTPTPVGEDWLSYSTAGVLLVTAIVVFLILIRVCKLKPYMGLPPAPQAMHLQPIYNP